MVFAPESLQGLCDRITTFSNSITLPIDADFAWASNMAAQNPTEAGQLTQQKPAFQQLTLTLGKYGEFVPVTQELIEDTQAIGAFVANKMAQKLNYKLSNLCYNVMKGAASRVTVPKTGGAAAGSPPDGSNIAAMWSKMPSPWRQDAVWVANPAIESALIGITISPLTVPLYIPVGGLVNSLVPRLLGRPVIWLEGAVAQGTEGDFMLVAPQMFYGVDKGGIRSDTSIHFMFDSDATVFRSLVRFVCASKLSAPITRADSTTASNVVTLATRA